MMLFFCGVFLGFVLGCISCYFSQESESAGTPAQNSITNQAQDNNNIFRKSKLQQMLQQQKTITPLEPQPRVVAAIQQPEYQAAEYTALRPQQGRMRDMGEQVFEFEL